MPKSCHTGQNPETRYRPTEQVGRSLYYGKVIPASVKQDVDKFVDQMRTKIEEQGKNLNKQRRKRLRHAEGLGNKWWACENSNL
jgi:hypothetical protein